jgi:hypothetical protein
VLRLATLPIRSCDSETALNDDHLICTDTAAGSARGAIRGALSPGSPRRLSGIRSRSAGLAASATG